MKLTCVFVFAYAKKWFSHNAAQFEETVSPDDKFLPSSLWIFNIIQFELKVLLRHDFAVLFPSTLMVKRLRFKNLRRQKALVVGLLMTLIEKRK